MTEKREVRPNSQYDQMSEKELDEALRFYDSAAYSDESADEILKICKVLSERDKKAGMAPDIDAAWERFKKKMGWI